VLHLIHDLAIRHGAEILYGIKALAYDSCSGIDKSIVILEGGKKMEADCVINAAGLVSLASISTRFETMNNWRLLGASVYMSVFANISHS
jgi:hypothetical protein